MPRLVFIASVSFIYLIIHYWYVCLSKGIKQIRFKTSNASNTYVDMNAVIPNTINDLLVEEDTAIMSTFELLQDYFGSFDDLNKQGILTTLTCLDCQQKCGKVFFSSLLKIFVPPPMLLIQVSRKQDSFRGTNSFESMNSRRLR